MAHHRMHNHPEAGLVGRYANLFKIGYNAFEVVLDAGQFYEGDKKSQMHTRIVTSPPYAKALLGLLSASMAEYEATFGIIPSGETE